MAAYVVLANFAGQGGQADMAQAGIQEFEKRLTAAGGRKIGIWGTLGKYDLVMILEAPNDEVIAQQMIMLGMKGNIRTQTLRAFSEDEMKRMMQGMQQ